jgi:hypothetical protein
VNSLLKPSDTSKAIIEIKNPDNVVADRFELKKFSKSTITRRTIDLGPRPIEGQWTIRATYGINEALSSEYHFEVRDYVLPRFDVTIVPPLHVTSNDENINVTVKAKYTYGKGVQGLLTLRLGVLEDDASNVTEFLNRQYTISADENGVKKISLQNRGYGIFPLNKRLWIYASVVERASGIKQTAKNTFVTFSSSRYRIQCDPVNRHYHPDLPVQGTVRVSHQAGHPAEEVGLEFTMSGTTQQRVTNSKGDAFYNFPAISSSSRLTINVRVLTEMVSVSCQLEPFSSPCPSTSSILIVSPSHLQEDFVEIKATDANFKILKHPANTRRIEVTVLVIARGLLQWATPLYAVNTETLLTISVKREWAKKFHVLAYYHDQTCNSMVSDARTLYMEDVFVNDVAIKTNVEKTEPGNQITVEIKAEKFSDIALLAVDAGLFILNNENKLTRQLVRA